MIKFLRAFLFLLVQAVMISIWLQKIFCFWKFDVRWVPSIVHRSWMECALAVFKCVWLPFEHTNVLPLSIETKIDRLLTLPHRQRDVAIAGSSSAGRGLDIQHKKSIEACCASIIDWSIDSVIILCWGVCLWCYRWWGLFMRLPVGSVGGAVCEVCSWWCWWAPHAVDGVRKLAVSLGLILYWPAAKQCGCHDPSCRHVYINICYRQSRIPGKVYFA